jgi:tetraprenyl-beta-curcumene synthase
MTETGNILGVDPKRTTRRPRSPANAPQTTNHTYDKCAFAGTAGRLTLGRAGLALVLANVRYWSTVAPLVRTQLARWEQAARTIPDPALRALALGKLRDERFNAQVAATLATLAPRVQRAHVVEAIVALQVLYDYVDLLTEQPAGEPPIEGRALLAALRDAVTLDLTARGTPDVGDGRATETDDPRDYYRDRPSSDDAGYLEALLGTVRTALGDLPNAAVIAPVAQAAAARCAEAQILNHRASRTGVDELRKWASTRATGTELSWQQFLAGATASVLAIGALIAAAANPATTLQDAEQIDALYLSIGALTMLDSLVDFQEDIAAGQLGYVQYYDDPALFAARLALLARDAVASAGGLRGGAHHIVTLVGIVAYYASAPAANSELARPLIAPVRRELRPLITPTLALMRAWRAAKRVRHA